LKIHARSQHWFSIRPGTLTRGEFNVVSFESLDAKFSKEEILSLAASLEQNSEHPIATGILRKSKELNQKVQSLIDFKQLLEKESKLSLTARM
jgi:Cu2+-exporting ATPase